MRSLIALGAAALLAACASHAPAAHPTSTTAPAPAAAPALPPVPLATGPLAVKVVYPVAGSLVEARDSNFIFGNVGNGKATLTIDGTPVPVLPNGSFLAFLPVPPRDSSRYSLVAALGADTVRVTQPVRLLPEPLAFPATGPIVVDSSSVAPRRGLALRDDELVRVAVRAPANALVTWVSPTETQALLRDPALGATPPAVVTGGAVTGAERRPVRVDSNLFSLQLPAAKLRTATMLEVLRGSDTLRIELPSVAPAPENLWGVVGTDTADVADVDREIIGRPTPGGTYEWFLLPGTPLQVTGFDGAWARVRLDSRLEIWLASSELRQMPTGWAPPRAVAGNARLRPSAEWVDLIIPVGVRPPYLVEEGDRQITLTLYGVTIDTDIINYGANDSLVRVARWTPDASDRGHFTLTLGAPTYGYLAFWENGNFVLRVRRPPKIDPEHPLQGLTIAVDPGHPPIGATGPTGLWEPVATLAVGWKVDSLLTARGAKVVMTRTTAAPVELGDRPIIARQANANALVSIHLNALPDGINPFTANGTGAYYFRAHSLPLARALQNGMVARMGLRNLGVNYDNLRLARPTWMPAVLCEGAFIMMPDQEAALRTPQFQQAYAQGIVDGLEAYFRALSDAR